MGDAFFANDFLTSGVRIYWSNKKINYGNATSGVMKYWNKAGMCTILTSGVMTYWT